MGSASRSGAGEPVKLALALVCDHARLGADGKLDIHGVLHDLYAQDFPARQDSMTLVVVLEWERDDHGRYTFRVDLVGPDGRPSLTVDGHTDVTPSPAGQPPSRTRLVMPLEHVIFPAPGGYGLRVRIKGRTLEGPMLHLIQAEPSGVPGEGPEAR